MLVPYSNKAVPYSSRNLFQTFHTSSKYNSTSSIQRYNLHIVDFFLSLSRIYTFINENLYWWIFYDKQTGRSWTHCAFKEYRNESLHLVTCNGNLWKQSIVLDRIKFLYWKRVLSIIRFSFFFHSFFLPNAVIIESSNLNSVSKAFIHLF